VTQPLSPKEGINVMADEVKPGFRAKPTAVRSRRLRIHLHVPSASAPAAHMVSGELKGAGISDLVKANGGESIGHQGQAYVMACDPKIVQSEWDRASGEWHAVRCEECYATEAFQLARSLTRHPKEQAVDEEACAPPPGCCG